MITRANSSVAGVPAPLAPQHQEETAPATGPSESRKQKAESGNNFPGASHTKPSGSAGGPHRTEPAEAAVSNAAGINEERTGDSIFGPTAADQRHRDSAGTGHGAGVSVPPISDLRSPISESDPRIFAAEFARLYQLPDAAAARRFMRRQAVPHIASGRDLFTRASWLASWEAKQAKNLTPIAYTTPRETFLATAAAMVGDMVKRGLIPFNPGRKLPS